MKSSSSQAHRRWVIFNKSYRLNSARFFLPKTSESSQLILSNFRAGFGGVDNSLTHGNTKQTNTNLNASYNVECLQNTDADEPVIGTRSQAKAEHVLKDQEACKSFNGNISFKIRSVVLAEYTN